MFKKVIGKTKDVMYQTVVEKDAAVLVKHLGDKEAIISYVEENKIPERKSSYEMLYEVLLEKLDDERAEILYRKKFHFVERRNLAVLWEEFADVNKDARMKSKIEKIEKKLARYERHKTYIAEKEIALQKEHAQLMREFGMEVATETEAEKSHVMTLPEEKTEQMVQDTTPVLVKEEIEEKIEEKMASSIQKEEEMVVSTQEEATDALLKETQEMRLFGETPMIDPTIREEEPPNEEEDPIMRNF